MYITGESRPYPWEIQKIFHDALSRNRRGQVSAFIQKLSEVAITFWSIAELCNWRATHSGGKLAEESHQRARFSCAEKKHITCNHSKEIDHWKMDSWPAVIALNCDRCAGQTRTRRHDFWGALKRATYIGKTGIIPISRCADWGERSLI